MIWLAASTACECGSCSARIATGDPVALFVGRLRRCRACAEREGFVYDEQAVVASRRALIDHQIDRELADMRSRHPKPSSSSFAPLRDAATDLFDAKLAAAEPRDPGEDDQ